MQIINFELFFEISSDLRTILRFSASAKTVALILKPLASFFPYNRQVRRPARLGLTFLNARLRLKLPTLTRIQEQATQTPTFPYPANTARKILRQHRRVKKKTFSVSLNLINFLIIILDLR